MRESMGNTVLDKAAFRKRVERIENLPTLPQLMEKFTRMIKDKTKSMSDVGEELAKDQVLTSKILRLVNSAFYGFPSRISSITHAMVLLGYDAIKGLIVSTSVFDKVNADVYPLWRHSIATSMITRSLGHALQLQDVEELAVAGLLHDLGKVVLWIEVPQEYRWAIANAEQTDRAMWQSEREVLGFDHADIGLWLCERWMLPPRLAEVIGYHHKPALAKANRQRVAVVAAAEAFARGMGQGAEQELPLFPLDPVVEELAGTLAYKIDALVDDILPQLDTLSTLEPKDI